MFPPAAGARHPASMGAHVCQLVCRPAEKLHLVGVTGTNGKSTVTYMLKAILETCGYKVGLVGTIQNMIGDRILPSGHTTPDPYDLHSMFALMAGGGMHLCRHGGMSSHSP